jgi:hypothetical protein
MYSVQEPSRMKVTENYLESQRINFITFNREGTLHVEVVRQSRGRVQSGPVWIVDGRSSSFYQIPGLYLTRAVPVSHSRFVAHQLNIITQPSLTFDHP